MPWLAAIFGNMLLSIAGSLVAQVLVGLGVGVVTYNGVDTAISFLKTNVVTAFTALPSEVVGILSLMQVGSCISMVFSAMVMRMTLQGVASGSKQFVKK
jgi:hypothetical protein